MSEINLEISEKETIGLSMDVGIKKVYPPIENLEVIPTKEQQVFNHENTYGYDEITVEAIPENYIEPEGTLEISENGEFDVATYRMVRTSVEGKSYMPVYMYNFNKNVFNTGAFNFIAGYEGDDILAIIQDAYDKGLELFIIKLIPTYSNLTKDMESIDLVIKISDSTVSLIDSYQNITIGSGTDIDLITVSKILSVTIEDGVAKSSKTNNYVLSLNGFNAKKSLSFLENDETYTGEKTFSVLPICGVVPATDKELTNKKYVDDQVATKQPLLTAGENITIVDNVISATGGGNSSANIDTVPTFMIYSSDSFWANTGSDHNITKGTMLGDKILTILQYAVDNNIPKFEIAIKCTNQRSFNTTYLNNLPPIRLFFTYDGATTISIVNSVTSLVYEGGYEYYGIRTYVTKKFTISDGIVKSNSQNQILTLTYFTPRSLFSREGGGWVTGATTFGGTVSSSTEPTSEQHLTTKKYVDNSISKAITTVLEAEY